MPNRTKSAKHLLPDSQDTGDFHIKRKIYKATNGIIRPIYRLGKGIQKDERTRITELVNGGPKIREYCFGCSAFVLFKEHTPGLFSSIVLFYLF